MTGVERGGGVPMGPPWPVEVLADLHAGALDDTVAGELWPLVQRDPSAREVLAALDATRADLGALATLPPPRMPADLAARLDTALAAEAGHRARSATPPPPIPFPQRQPQPGFAPAGPPPQPGSVTNLADARKRRNRTLGWAGGLVVAAAAALGIVFATLPGTTTTPGNGVAAPPPGAGAAPTGAPLALTKGGLNAGLVAQVGTTSDYGPLSDPQRRQECLAANGVAAGTNPIGAQQVTLDGKPGVLMVLTTGQLAQYRLLVVGPGCAAGTPDTLASTTVGGIPVPTTTK